MDCEHPPTILHGKTELSVENDGVDVRATYSCDSGYQLYGSSQLICDTDTDMWQSDLPACKLGNFMISEFYEMWCLLLFKWTETRLLLWHLNFIDYYY